MRKSPKPVRYRVADIIIQKAGVCLRPGPATPPTLRPARYHARRLRDDLLYSYLLCVTNCWVLAPQRGKPCQPGATRWVSLIVSLPAPRQRSAGLLQGHPHPAAPHDQSRRHAPAHSRALAANHLAGRTPLGAHCAVALSTIEKARPPSATPPL
jgi:hypothetical protein